MQHLSVWAVPAALAGLVVVTTAPAGGWPDKVGLAGCWPAKICYAAARAARAWPANVQQLAAVSSPVKGALARAGVVPAVEAGPAPVPKAELLPGPNVGACRPNPIGIVLPKGTGLDCPAAGGQDCAVLNLCPANGAGALHIRSSEKLPGASLSAGAQNIGVNMKCTFA